MICIDTVPNIFLSFSQCDCISRWRDDCPIEMYRIYDISSPHPQHLETEAQTPKISVLCKCKLYTFSREEVPAHRTAYI